jgi:hypothetical protein
VSALPLDHEAFDQADSAYRHAYGRAYTLGTRHALDEADRRQAHDEAHTEALEAAILADQEHIVSVDELAANGVAYRSDRA